MSNQIRKEDILDTDFADAYELRSDGYDANSIYLSNVSIISTTTGTNTVIVNLAFDGGGIFYSHDHPVEKDDIVWLQGTSGADGYYTVNTVIDDNTFTTNEPIVSSTGGLAEFRYPSGSLKVGYDITRYPAVNIGHNNVQEAVQDLDLAITGKITTAQHETLRQLIHFIDSGPGNGFSAQAFKQTLPINSILPTSIIWYLDVGLTIKLVEQLITWSGIVPSTIVWNIYNSDGITIKNSITDTFTYSSSIFESVLTRTFS